MSGNKSRITHTSEFKAKVALEALKEEKTINEIGQQYGVHPTQVRQWKKELQENASILFDKSRGPTPKPQAEHRQSEQLYKEIGRLTVELDWIKKKSGICLP